MTYKKRLQMPEAGGSTCQNDKQNSSLKKYMEVGQHPRITNAENRRHPL